MIKKFLFLASIVLVGVNLASINANDLGEKGGNFNSALSPRVNQAENNFEKTKKLSNIIDYIAYTSLGAVSGYSLCKNRMFGKCLIGGGAFFLASSFMFELRAKSFGCYTTLRSLEMIQPTSLAEVSDSARDLIELTANQTANVAQWSRNFSLMTVFSGTCFFGHSMWHVAFKNYKMATPSFLVGVVLYGISGATCDIYQNTKSQEREIRKLLGDCTGE